MNNKFYLKFMNEVALLPKNVISAHSKPIGHLKQYQEKLTQKYLEIIGFLQKSAEQSSKSACQILQDRMQLYQSDKKILVDQQRSFLESMGKNAMNFDQLKQKLEMIGNEMIEKSIKLREDSIIVYDKAFSELQPIVNDCFKQCETFMSQLPAPLPIRIENVVKRLNESYISTKTSLIRSLYNEEINVRNLSANAEEEFEQRIDEWRVNKFSVLVEEAKAQLDFKKMVNFDEIFLDFYNDQKKFNLCFKKVLQNVSLIMPPDNFTEEKDFQPWWNEVEEMRMLHQNFINTFIQKIEDKINEMKKNNLELVENLEKELLTLKTENDANQAMSEVIPLFKQCRKYSDNFLNKLKKYWENRVNAIQTAFNSIKDFILPIIQMYQECVTTAKETRDDVTNSQNELREKSGELLNQLENDLNSQTNAIQMLVSETEINNQVENCKQTLLKIESEYRSYYDKAVEIYEQRQPKILQTFEEKENSLLTFVKMRKTSNPPDWLLNSGRSNSISKMSAPGSVRRQRRPSSRAVKKRTTKKGKESEKVEIFHFELENGSGKFEESEPLSIIPQIEDFVDESALPPLPTKGKGSRSKTASQNKNVRGSGNSGAPGKGNNNGSKGNSKSGNNGSNSQQKMKAKIDDLDDVEVPDFILMNTVPRIGKDNQIIPPKPVTNTESNESMAIDTNSPTKKIVNSINRVLSSSKIPIAPPPTVPTTSNTNENEKEGEKLGLSENSSSADFDSGEISIIVYTPDNSEVDEWKNVFRRALISSFEKMFADEMRDSCYEKEKDKLANELSERMRTYAPRANSIELNVAQTRLIKIETRMVQLEKYFRKATQDFNKGLKTVETGIDKLATNVKNETQTLRHYIDDLEKQKNSTTFQQLNQEFTIRVKNFSTKFAQQLESQKEAASNFIAGFKASNERFVNSLGGTEEVFSDEERDMCMKFFERMDGQVGQIVEALNNKENELKTEIDSELKSITDEFNSIYPHHKSDMVFIDELKALQAEAKSKLDTLIFKNKQSEADINRVIENVQSNRDNKNDPQIALEKEFEKIEKMRLAIIKRARFLNFLKSKLSLDSIPFNLNLATELEESQKIILDPSLLSARKSQAKIRTSQAKVRPDSAKKVTNARTKAEQANEVLQTIQGQVDNIGSELITKLNPIINEYYASLKQRKYQITRPTLIPPVANECIEQNKKLWEKTMSIMPSILEECCRVFKNQIAKASEMAHKSLPIIFSLYLQFYNNHLEDSYKTIKQEFNESFEKVISEREKHRKALNPKIIDENNSKLLKSLMDEESVRRQNEIGLIKNFNFSILNNEYKEMQLFVNHLPLVTRVLLQTFDSFVLPEDLTDYNATKGNNKSGIENVQRMTLKEMLKEKERRAMNPVNDPIRPFAQKTWPTMNSVMSPLFPFITQFAEQIAAMNSNGSNISAAPTASNLSIASFVSNSNTNISPKKGQKRSRKADSRKKDESKNAEELMNEKLPPQSSLETSLHRGVIIERNNCYAEYESNLGQRVEQFNAYISSLEQEGESFDEHWKQCILSMKPDFKFPTSTNDSK